MSQDEQDEQAYREFMEAVNNGDTSDLSTFWNAFLAEQLAKKDDMEYTPTTTAPQTLLQIWQEAHPDAIVYVDESEEWVIHSTEAEADPNAFVYEDECEEWDDCDDEDLDMGWRYIVTPENKDAYIAIAPSLRALRAYISGELILRNNPKVIRVTYRNYTCVAKYATQD